MPAASRLSHRKKKRKTSGTRVGEGRITEDEICPNSGKKFQCYSDGVFEGENDLLQVYADDSVFCDDCVAESD